ncbi:MAG: hypothetical protein AAGJ35_14450 [Myxococcota bacterium]
MSKSGKAMALVGSLALVGVMGFFPYMFMRNQQKSMQNSPDPLNPSQIRRGQFMNSGSKDVGIDPNWDPKTGTYHPKGRN